MKKFTKEDAQRIGDELKLDWDKYDINEFTMGLNVELEHGSKNPDTNVTNDDEIKTAKIAISHLNELKDYYTKLKAMENDGSSHQEDTQKNLNVNDIKPIIKKCIINLVKGWANHKYIRRTGSPGNYTYWYKDLKSGLVYQTNKEPPKGHNEKLKIDKIKRFKKEAYRGYKDAKKDAEWHRYYGRKSSEKASLAEAASKLKEYKKYKKILLNKLK